jgi:hypothetical protein
MTTYSILYNGDIEIDSQMLNNIIQSVITFADSIWINSNIALSKNMPAQIKENAHNIIKVLEDKQIIKRWSFPTLERDQKIKVIPFDEYEEINNQINEIFLANKNLLATISRTYLPIRDVKKEIETTSKVISIRKEYWSVAIANYLGASRLSITPQYKNMWLYASEKLRYPLVEKKLVEYILENFCYIPDLTILKPGDILKLHSKNKSIREKICETSEDIFTEFQYTSDIEPLAQKMQDGVWEYVEEVTGGKRVGTIKNVGYAISSIFIPALSVLPLVDEFITWLSTKREYGYVLFLSELKKISRGYMRKV